MSILKCDKLQLILFRPEKLHIIDEVIRDSIAAFLLCHASLARGWACVALDQYLEPGKDQNVRYWPDAVVTGRHLCCSFPLLLL